MAAFPGLQRAVLLACALACPRARADSAGTANVEHAQAGALVSSTTSAPHAGDASGTDGTVPARHSFIERRQYGTGATEPASVTTPGGTLRVLPLDASRGELQFVVGADPAGPWVGPSGIVCDDCSAFGLETEDGLVIRVASAYGLSWHLIAWHKKSKSLRFTKEWSWTEEKRQPPPWTKPASWTTFVAPTNEMEDQIANKQRAAELAVVHAGAARAQDETRTAALSHLLGISWVCDGEKGPDGKVPFTVRVRARARAAQLRDDVLFEENGAILVSIEIWYEDYRRVGSDRFTATVTGNGFIKPEPQQAVFAVNNLSVFRALDIREGSFTFVTSSSQVGGIPRVYEAPGRSRRCTRGSW